MADDLSLRRTVIGGETAPDDYIVIWDDLPIGRIYKSAGVGGGPVWSWSCGLANVPQRSDQRGRAATLEAAKAEFRSAWQRHKQEISHAEIQQARALANDRGRPWHTRD